MSKAVLISIRPEWCNKIAGGQKSVEIRKTEPNLKKPFKCYIYCTKSTHFVDIPETKSQGLFHQIQEEVTFCGLLHEAYA